MFSPPEDHTPGDARLLEALELLRTSLAEAARRKPELVDALVLLAESLRHAQTAESPLEHEPETPPVPVPEPVSEQAAPVVEPSADPVQRVPETLSVPSPAPEPEPPSWSLVRPDLERVQKRARLKAEALDWAVRRRQLLEEEHQFDRDIKPNDQRLSEEAAALGDCYLWMLAAHGAQEKATEEELHRLARGYRALAQAAGEAHKLGPERLAEERSLPEFLSLVAEAQSALGRGLREIQAAQDKDQYAVWAWLRQMTDRHRIFLERYMSLETPASLDQLADYPDRFGGLIDRIQARLQGEKRRQQRIHRIEYHVGNLEEKLARGDDPESRDLEHDWRRIAETVHDWVSDGDHVTDERLLSAISRVAAGFPEEHINDHVGKVLTAVEPWLDARSDAGDRSEGDPELIDAGPSSVQEAFEEALQRYPERLALALNNRSQKDYPYFRPREVREALEWLATVVWPGRAEGGAGLDHRKLSVDLQQRCGWFYLPRQSPTTMGRFKDWYSCVVDGRSLDLHEHMGRGNTRRQGPRSIRIAFAWDDVSRRIVIGFLGQHQKTE